MIKVLWQWSWVCVLAAFTTACSVQSDVDSMIKTSQNIEDQSKHLSKRTDDLERELVNKESNTTLNDFLDILFGDGKFGAQPVTEPTLLEEAGFAMESMHFQYWKGDYNEPLAVLDDFFSQSLEILFVHSSAHIPRDFNVNVLQPGRDYKAIGSLGSQLGRMRAEYAANLTTSGLKNYSAYDVIVQALKNRDRFERTEALPKSTALVLQWKQDAIYMLQLRQVYLPVTVLARLTDFQDKKDLSWKFWDTRAWDAIVGGSLTIDFATNDPMRKIDPEQLKLYTLWLNQSLQTRQDLIDICVEPQTNAMLNGILSKVKILLPTTGGASPRVEVAKTLAAQGDFVAAYKKVLSQQASTNLVGSECGR